MTSDDELRRIYSQARTIAVVGASGDPAKPAHSIPRYLQTQGYRIVPVTPRGGELLGERAYASLTDVDVPVDVVNVFRPADEVPDIAHEAADLGAKVLWTQTGIESDAAAEIAHAAGMTVVMGVCMGRTHERLGLGPGP
ncbi:MAG TPA: CoA-binding protein [Egibacteraceae bacterium]|nr:CoA-binding protein [Egibacteraceae bacterium]